jgi:hypothetical protein
MPVIYDSISSKINEGVLHGLKKKNEKENIETHHIPTIKQVLTAKIEYEEAPNHANSTLNSLQSKYIILKPNQQATNGNFSLHNYAILSISILQNIAFRKFFVLPLLTPTRRAANTRRKESFTSENFTRFFSLFYSCHLHRHLLSLSRTHKRNDLFQYELPCVRARQRMRRR